MLEFVLLQASGGSSPWGTLILFGGMFVVMYFFMIRPQQKKSKDQKAFRENLKKGDDVITVGGLHGKIVSVDGDTITLEVDKSIKLTFEKSSISSEAKKA